MEEHSQQESLLKVGYITEFKSKNDLIDDHYKKFVSEFNFDKDEYWKIKIFLKFIQQTTVLERL